VPQRASIALLRLLRALALLGLLATVPVWTAPVASWHVEVDAPPDLKKLLESELDAVRWSQRTDLTPQQVEQLFDAAPAQARALAETEGLFEARVREERGVRDGRPLLRLIVQPGEPTRISAVHVRIEGAVTSDPQGQARVDRAQRAFGLEPGAVFRQVDWTAAKERVVRNLAAKRYAAARIVESRAQIDPAARTAVLDLTVDSGPTITMGGVRVTGLSRYPEKLVQTLNPIPPGALYDEEALLRYQRRLTESGHFASALVTVNPDPARPTDTLVLVRVVESEARRVELGVGYSTDRGPRAQASYTDNNTLDRAWRFNTTVEVDGLTQEGRAGLTFPRQADGWRWLVGGQVKHENIQDQDVLNWSVTGGHLYAVEEYESQQSVQYLTERTRLADGTRDTSDALFFNQRWLWNTLDDPINPRRGSTFQIQVGGAAEALLSTQTFGRVHLRANHLQRLNPSLTLQLRGEAGAVLAQTRKDIPSEYLFRTGGDTSIRGFAYESLGVEEGGAVVGGRYLAVGSVELIAWFTPEWGVAGFLDGGNAWDDISRFDPVYGIGSGVRWRSPLGNLNLDLAWPEGRGQGRIHFSVGIIFR
jgi:translocation and assembly module TamA